MPSFGVSAISAKNPSLFNIFSTSDIQLMKSPQYDKQYFNMHYGFERPFLPAGVFLPCNPSSFDTSVTDIRTGSPHPGSFCMLAVIELSLLADI